MIKTRRIYDEPFESDGYRVLVDRLWPRGLKKDDVHFDEWLKDIAPSAELRKWFDHDPGKWNEFQQKYSAELHNSDAMARLKKIINANKTVTLLYSAKDEKHNQAVALKESGLVKKLWTKRKS